MIAVLALLAIAWLFDLGLMAYAVYALAAALGLSWWLTRTWGGALSATRKMTQLKAEVGQASQVTLTLKNSSWLPIPWVLAEDMLPGNALIHEPPALGVGGDRLSLTSIAGNGDESLEYVLKCNRRGYYQIGPAVIETGDFFGLYRKFLVVAEPQFLTVYPEVKMIEGFEIASNRPIGEVRMAHRLFEDPTRIAGVRAYQAGDPLNRVHWKATARSGKLHSKIYESSSVVGATLLLDFHQASYRPGSEPYRSELAVTATASIANAVYQLGQQIGLATNARDAADRVREEGWEPHPQSRTNARQAKAMLNSSDRLEPVMVETRQGVEQFMEIRETLARVELTDGLELSELLAAVSGRLPRDATVIAVVSLVTEATAIALGNLRREGYAVTAIVNQYETSDFTDAAGRLMSERVHVVHLRDEESISQICRSFLLSQVS